MSRCIDCALVALVELTSNKPAEEEERDQAAPDLAVIPKAGGAGQHGEHGQQQGDGSRYQQIDGDVGLPWTVILVHYSCETQGQNLLMIIFHFIGDNFNQQLWLSDISKVRK